jgi:hypothetical protein
MYINEATFLRHKKFNLKEFKFYGTFKPTTFNFHNKKKLLTYKGKKNQKYKSEQSVKHIKKERNIDQFELSNQ